MFQLLYTCAAFALAGAGATGSGEQSYDITLHRPMAIGDQMSIVAEGTEERTVTAIIDGNAQQLDNTQMTVEFTADAEVLEIDAQGRATQMQYTLKRCVMTINGTTDALAPAGTMILAFRNGDEVDTQYSIDGKLLSPNQIAALSLIIGLDSGGPTDDEVFGTDQPKTIGDQWPINSENAIHSLSSGTRTPLSGSDVTGRTTLLSARDYNGQPCLMLSNRLTVENFVPGLDDMPRGFELKRAFVTAMQQGLYPLDETQPMLQDSLNMDLDAVMIGALGPDQPAAVLQLRGSRAASRRYTMLKSGDKIATGSQD